MQFTPGDHAMIEVTKPTAKPAPLDAMIFEIAAKHLFIETLETRNSDSLDFHDVASHAA